MKKIHTPRYLTPNPKDFTWTHPDRFSSRTEKPGKSIGPCLLGWVTNIEKLSALVQLFQNDGYRWIFIPYFQWQQHREESEIASFIWLKILMVIDNCRPVVD